MASWEVQCTHRVGVLSNEFDFVICMYDSLLFVISHAVNLVQPVVHSTISVKFPLPEVGGVHTQLSFETQTSISVLYILFVYFSIFCTYVHMYVSVPSGCQASCVQSAWQVLVLHGILCSTSGLPCLPFMFVTPQLHAYNMYFTSRGLLNTASVGNTYVAWLLCHPPCAKLCAYVCSIN